LLDIALPWGTPHNGSSANGWGDGDLYCLLVEADSASSPTALSLVFGNRIDSYLPPGSNTNGSLSTIMPDLNGDGTPELFYLEGHDPTYYRGPQHAIAVTQNGSLIGRWTGFSDRGKLLATVLDDLNQDNVRELAFSGEERDGFYVVDGATLTTIALSASGGRVLGAADFNGDGRTDLIVHEQASGFVRVIDTQSLVAMGSWNIGSFPGAWMAHALFAISDVTGNGRLELLMCTPNGFYVLDSGAGWCRPFGQGCGRNGGSRLAGSFGQVPTRNVPFDITVSGLPFGLPAGSVFVLLGLDEQRPPMDLTAIGMPGCSLFVGGTYGMHLVPCTYLPIGLASCRINMPNLPGVRFYTQGLALDAAANQLGLSMSNAAVGMIGR
jgi:hypothetical protein